MRTVLHYLIGYGVPLFIILITTSLAFSGYDVYLRRDSDDVVVACYLSVDAMPAITVPAILVAVINAAVTATAIYIAHKAGKRRSNISSKEQILSTLRNTVLLSLLLGLTWITAAIPTSAAQQYISVILNTSCGFYILVYSVLANRQVRGGVRERVSTYYSTVLSSGNSKDKDSSSSPRFKKMFKTKTEKTVTNGNSDSDYYSEKL